MNTFIHILPPGVISSIAPYKVVGCILWSNINLIGFAELNDGKYIKIKKDDSIHNLSQQDVIEFYEKDKAWLESQVLMPTL